jgi:hypothetical protein
MANLFVNLPVVANGAGAFVDVSAMGATKTITVDGSFRGAVLIEYAADAAGLTFVPLVTFGTPGKRTFEVAATLMRVRTNNFVGTANVDVGANDNGSQRATLPAPAGNGSAAAVDVSALGTLHTIVVGGVYSGVVLIELSEDGIDFVDVVSVAGPPMGVTKSFTAQFMRVTRMNVNPSAPGVPSVEVCAANDDISSVVVASAPVQSFVFRPGDPNPRGNVYTDWNALVAALATVEGYKLLEFDDSIISPIVIPPGGPYDMTGVVWSGTFDHVFVFLTIGNCTFTNLRHFQKLLDVTFTGTVAPAIDDVGPTDLITFEIGVTLRNLGTVPFIRASGLGPGDFCALGFVSQAVWETGTAPIFDCPNAGTLFLTALFSAAIIGSDTISGVVGAAWVRQLFATGVILSADQSGYLGAVGDETQSITRAFPDQTLHVGPAGLTMGFLFRGDTTGGAFAFSLPPASSVYPGDTVIVKHVAGAAALTVTPDGADTIDGAAGAVVVPAPALGARLMLARDVSGSANWISI